MGAFMKSYLMFTLAAMVCLSACQPSGDSGAGVPGGPGPAPIPAYCASTPYASGCSAVSLTGVPTGDVQVSSEKTLITMMEENGFCGQRGNKFTRLLVGPKCTDYVQRVSMQIAPAPTAGVYNVTLLVGGAYLMVFPTTFGPLNPTGFALMSTSLTNYTPGQTVGPYPTSYQTAPGQYNPTQYRGVHARGLTVVARSNNSLNDNLMVVQLQYNHRKLGDATLIRH